MHNLIWRLFKKDCRWEKVSLMQFIKEDVDNNGDGFMGIYINKWNTSNIIEGRDPRIYSHWSTMLYVKHERYLQLINEVGVNRDKQYVEKPPSGEKAKFDDFLPPKYQYILLLWFPSVHVLIKKTPS